jgi:hypothetical protein
MLERIPDLESHGMTRKDLNLSTLGAPKFYVFNDEIEDKRLVTVQQSNVHNPGPNNRERSSACRSRANTLSGCPRPWKPFWQVI